MVIMDETNAMKELSSYNEVSKKWDFNITVKDDFHSVLRNISTSMFVSLTRWNANRCSSLRTHYQLYLRHLYSFSNSFFAFCNNVVVSSSDVRENKVYNGGWHETLRFIQASCCEMSHFVTPYMRQHKQCKQINSWVRSTDWKTYLSAFHSCFSIIVTKKSLHEDSGGS